MIVGQRVVCVDDRFRADVAALYIALPIAGVIYTIREVKVGQSPAGVKGEVCVYLRDLHNPLSAVAPFHERGFNAERFRPLEEMEVEEILATGKPAEYTGKNHD